MDDPPEPARELDGDTAGDSGPAATPIVIEAELTAEDWAAWLAAWSASARARVGVLRVIAAVVLPMLTGIGVVGFWRGSRPALLPFLVGGLTYVACIKLVQRVYRHASEPAANGWVLGPFRLDVSPEGLHWYRTQATTIVRWPAVLDVTHTRSHVFVWTDTFSAFIIPVRDLPSALDANHLVATLRGFAGLPPLAPTHVFTPPAEEDAARERVGFWGALGRRLTWQPVDERATPSNEWTVAVGAALSIAIWIGLDRAAAGAGAAWTTAGFGGLAWYALGVVAVVWVLHRASTGRVRFGSLLAATAGAMPLLVALVRSIQAWAPDSWTASAYVVAAVAAVWLAHRTLVSAAGWPQPRAVLLSGLTAGVFALASMHADVYTHFFYSLDEETDSDDGPSDEGVEQVAFEQAERIDEAAEAIAPGRSGRPDVFFLGFAGVAEQKVFAEELKLAERVVARRYDADHRSLLLVNDRRDRDAFPIATGPGLARALRRLGERMDDEDVLFLMITSHGSSTPAISVTNGDWPFADLDGDSLREALASSGIRWRVIVISACYSGAFVGPLADDHTIIVTSSAADRTSFGCSDENDVTDFGAAFVRDALPGAASLAAAFETARASVESSETARGLASSQPQIHVGSAIEAHWARIEARHR
jgi:hypothetical protein